MCFSASASFTAAGLLAVIGSVTISKAKKHYRMLASIPFLFAIQQAMEGFLWLSFEHTRLMFYQSYFMYGFLFFAFLLWPIWMPFSLYIIEPIKSRKIMLLGCVFAGILVSLRLLHCLLFYGINAQIVDYHIVYQIDFPAELFSIIIFYLSATILPCFISSISRVWLFGITLSISYLVTFYFYQEAFVSVWCFFAALLSILILLVVS